MEKEATTAFEQIQGLNELRLLDEERALLALRGQELILADMALVEATSQLSTAKHARDEQVKRFKSTRQDLGMAIAMDESIEPVRRAIWSRGFYLTEKVKDPEEFGSTVEQHINQFSEKLQPGTPLLQVWPSNISIARVETPGLVTNLELKDAPSYSPTTSGKELSGGNISTHPMRWTTVSIGSKLLSSEEFSVKEEDLKVRNWSDGDSDNRHLKEVFVDNTQWLNIGEDAIRQYVEAEPDDNAPDIRESKRFWVFVIASELGIDFTDFARTPVFQQWKEKAEKALAKTMAKLATGGQTYESHYNPRRRQSSVREVYGMESWPTPHLLSLMSVFKIEPKDIKDRVIKSLEGEVPDARAASHKVMVLNNLDSILELLV